MSDLYLDAFSALEARMRMVDIATNNLANANTVGFKRDFGHILKLETGNEAASQVDLSAGDLVQTNNELDVAITGPGMFALETPNGVRYTRSGNFGLNAAGELVTRDSMKVLSTSGSPITIGEGKVEIRDGGVITVDGNEVATLKVVSFSDPTMIEKEGLSRMAWNGLPSGVQPVSEPQVKGGFLERSNVNAIDEMVHLMAASREFDAVQRTLKTMMSDMHGKLIQELGRL
ncbi:MAG TPA: flagellar hook-basal body protein [Terriglobia bacterium]|nr:flagellar hook-basal body protein [Terriglobia bacterium]